MRRVVIFAVLFAMLATMAIATSATAAGIVTIYNNIPDPVPSSLPSLSFEAAQVSELGDRIVFAASTPRVLDSVRVVMNSRACVNGNEDTNDCFTTPGATFDNPITLNIYNVGPSNGVGSLIATTTQTFAIPYRPSKDDVNCTGADAGKWFDGSVCKVSLSVPVVFDLTSLSVTVPDEVIVSVAYNTTQYGYSPYGLSAPCVTEDGGCGYDNLNVSFTSAPASVTVGSNPAPNDAYLYAAGGYCAAMPTPINVFRLDSGCWGGLQAAITVYAQPTPVPDIALTPASHDFGAIVVSSTSGASSFTVTNNGTANLTISGVSLSGLNPGSFAIDTNGCNAAVLAPTQSCAIGIVFRPTSLGSKLAQLLVASDDPDTPTAASDLTGTGQTAPTVANGSITIILDAHPDSSQPFAFTGTNGIGAFSLTNDGSGVNSAFFGDKAAGIYTFRVAKVPQWALIGLTCDAFETILRSHRLVVIQLMPGQNVTCTFTESLRSPDASIALTSSGPYSGDNIFSQGVIASQTLSQSLAPAEMKSFFVQLQNDGVDQDRFRVSSTLDGSPNFQVQFFVGTVEVTGKVNAGTYRFKLLPGATRILEIRVQAQSGITPTESRAILVTMQSRSARAARDTVEAFVYTSG